MIGTSLNQYRITATLGAGGVGEVFRARDTRLNRDVAVKVLPAKLRWAGENGLSSGASQTRLRPQR